MQINRSADRRQVDAAAGNATLDDKMRDASKVRDKNLVPIDFTFLAVYTPVHESVKRMILSKH